MNANLSETGQVTDFYALREAAHLKCQTELAKRLAENPEKTDLETQMGCYTEELEPQVRDAVIDLTMKGYRSASSGFFGTPDNSSGQSIDFYGGELVLPDEVVTQLESMGVAVTTSDIYNGHLIFKAEKADMEYLAQRWNEIAAVIPPKKK